MPKTFSQFITESVKARPVVLSFGRMNPPTVGHAKLIDKIAAVAHKVGGEPRFYPSKSQGPKDPIPYKQKVSFLKSLFPQVKIMNDPNAISLFHVLKDLSDNGHTNVRLIVGSDRVEDFRKSISRYVHPRTAGFDPKKHYGFDHFEVISAGERDPEATGVEGMSASKLRAFAAHNDYTHFAQGIPTKNVALKKEIYQAVKAHLREDYLEEGPHDPAIFKAVFITGGPGSGKSFIASQIKNLGLVEINSDVPLEHMMKVHHLNFDIHGLSPKDRQDFNVLRGKAKTTTKVKERLAIDGRLGLLINIVGEDVNEVREIKNYLEQIGYETMFIYVQVTDETSSSRNKARLETGGRRVPEDIRFGKLVSLQRAVQKLWMLFDEGRFIVVNNDASAKDNRASLTNLFVKVRNFLQQPPMAPQAIHWIKSYTGRFLIPEASSDLDTVIQSKPTDKKTNVTFTRSNNPPGEGSGTGRFVGEFSTVAEANVSHPDATGAIVGALNTSGSMLGGLAM